MSLARIGLTAALGGLWVLHERRGRKNTARLAGALLETLLFAIDANDEETGEHVRRVARFACVLGAGAGLDEHEMRTVERVALFHDIGKIHEALLDIVRDEGGLTAEQKSAIATHPDRGAEVLSPLCGFYPELPEGVVAHHEQWDGRGYPLGLRGLAIPLTARIVAIADTFDVVTHGRSYSTKRTLADARVVIEEGRGTQFDPVLVDIFLSERVFLQVEDLLRESRVLVRGHKKKSERRHGERERGPVPDITFRWRSEVPGRRRRGRQPLAPRE